MPGGLVERPDADVPAAQSQADPLGRRRPGGEPPAHLVGRPVERLPHSQVGVRRVAASRLRLAGRLPQQVVEDEGVDGGRLVGLVLGPPAGGDGSPGGSPGGSPAGPPRGAGRPRFVHVGDSAAGVRCTGRTDGLRDAIRAVLASAGEGGLTRKGIWDALPDRWRRNHAAVAATVNDGVGDGWEKEERATKLGGAVFRLAGQE